MALLYWEQGKYAEAEPLYERVLVIWEEKLGLEHPNVATGLNNLASLYFDQGKYSKAEALFKRSLFITEKKLGSNHVNVARSLNNLATLYFDQVKYAEAEPLSERCLTIVEKALGPNHPYVAFSLVNLGKVYRIQGRYVKAEPLYRRSLTILEKTLGSNHSYVAPVLNNLADLAYVQGKYAEAESLFKRCVAIGENALGPNHPSVALSLNNLAVCYQTQGKYADAESLHKRALVMREKSLGHDHADVAMSLNDLAKTMFVINDEKRENILHLLDQSIRILDATTAYPDRKVDAYTLRARVHKQMSDLESALSDLIGALNFAEKLRPQIGGGEEIRAGFFEKYTDHFNRMVAWQLESEQIEQALEYAERGRARVLLDQFATSHIDLRSSISADIRVPLENREAEAKARMTEYQQRIKLLPSRIDLSDAQKNAEIAALKDSLRAAERDYQQVYEEIKAASPLWREVITSSGQPVDLVTAQSRLVPAKGMILLYQIGKEESFLFIIPPAGEKTEAFPLKVSSKVASTLGITAGPLKTAELKKILVGKEANGGLLKHLKNSEIDQSQTVFAQLQALWQVLVPESLWSRLVGCNEVVIIPDGVLHLLPFEALVVKSDVTPSATRYWLDEGPVIRYAPSLTTLYNLERRSPAATSTKQAWILSLSDPIFDPKQVARALQGQSAEVRASAKDSLSSSLGEPDSLQVSQILRASFSRAGESLRPLKATARETQAIREAFGNEAVLALMQFDANESKLRAGLPGKRYLHLSTHGVVDEQGVTLFAALALTPPPEMQTLSEDDGFLQLHEIYDLKLPECELTVLSACETNFGRQFEGEGIFALSRGLVTCSMW